MVVKGDVEGRGRCGREREMWKGEGDVEGRRHENDVDEVDVR
jgi:hypothetical protein